MTAPEDTLYVEDVIYALENATGIDVSNTTDQNFTGLSTGQDSTSGANTPVQLNGGSSLAVPDGTRVRVKALSGNGGAVYIGQSGVTTGDGYELAAGDEAEFWVDDVSTLHLVDGTGGYGVSWAVEQ